MSRGSRQWVSSVISWKKKMQPLVPKDWAFQADDSRISHSTSRREGEQGPTVPLKGAAPGTKLLQPGAILEFLPPPDGISMRPRDKAHWLWKLRARQESWRELGRGSQTSPWMPEQFFCRGQKQGGTAQHGETGLAVLRTCVQQRQRGAFLW